VNYLLCFTAALGLLFASCSAPVTPPVKPPVVAEAVLKWDASVTPGVEYNIYRAQQPPGNFSKLTTVNGLAYVDTGVKSGNTYSYYVTAYSQSNGLQSLPTNTVTVTVP
jgi:fibronectin type 3 domain-containing protein